MIVLLVIFMIAIPAITAPPVLLPEAGHAKEHAGEPIPLVVTAAGLVLVGPVPMTLSALGPYLQERLEASTAAPAVVIQADRDADYAAVVRVMNVCRQAGAAEIGLATQPRIAP